MSGGGAMAEKNPPTNVIALIANATARLSSKKKPPRLIPEATLMNRIKRRRQGR
jgi:hypothetical protein